MSASAAFNALDANGDGVLSREEFAQMQGGAVAATTMPAVTYAAAPGGYAAMPTTYTMPPQVVGEPAVGGAVTYAAAPTTYLTAAPGQTVTYAGGQVAGGQVMYAGPATTTTAAPVYVQPQPAVQYMTGGEQAGAVTYAAPQEPGAITYAHAPTVTYLAAPGAEAGGVQYVQQPDGSLVQYAEALPTVTYAAAPGAVSYVVDGATAPAEMQGGGSVAAAPAGVSYSYGSVSASPYTASAPTVTYLQPGAVTYQTVAGAGQPAFAYDGATQFAVEGAAAGHMIAAPTYVAQQVQPSIPSFVAAPGSVTYGLPATQASVPPQGSIAYAHPGVMQMQYPTEPGAVMMNSPSMVAYPGQPVGVAPGMEPGQPGFAQMQQPGMPAAAPMAAAPGSAAGGVAGGAASAKAGSKKKDKSSKKKGTSKKKSKGCC